MVSLSELVLPVIAQVSVSDLRMAHNPDMPLFLAFQGLFISLLCEKGVSAPVIKCKKTPRKKCSFVAEEEKKR